MPTNNPIVPYLATDHPIAVVTPGTHPLPSGHSSSVELVVTNVSEQLRLSQIMSLHLFGLKTKSQPAQQWVDGVIYDRVPRTTYIRHVYDRLRVLQPALIQVENRPRFARYLKRKLPRYPVILSLHSTTFISEPHIGKKRLLACLHKVDAILVNSHYLKNVLMKLDPALAGKLVVNHLGVDPARFPSRWLEEYQAVRQEYMESLGWAGCQVILFVGRFIPIKGVHHLLKAMPDILERHPNTRLLLVGGAFYGSNKTTPYVAKLHRLAKVLGDKVRFVPYVPHEQIAEWFRLADMVVVPSAEREAFGLVNVEAMASGVPVVATRAGGMREVIEHGRTGLLVSLSRLKEELPESICTLLQNPELARQLGEQGRERVLEYFTWSHTANRLTDLYHKLRKQ